MWTRFYWAQVSERAVKSFAQGLLWLFGAEQTPYLNMAGDWRVMVKLAGGLMLLSVATSIVTTPLGPKGSPSLVAAPREAALDEVRAVARGLVGAVQREPTVGTAGVIAKEKAMETAEVIAATAPAPATRRRWPRIVMIVVSVLWVGTEIALARDGNALTNILVDYVPAEVLMAFVAGLAGWLVFHFRRRVN